MVDAWFAKFNKIFISHKQMFRSYGLWIRLESESRVSSSIFMPPFGIAKPNQRTPKYFCFLVDNLFSFRVTWQIINLVKNCIFGSILDTASVRSSYKIFSNRDSWRNIQRGIWRIEETATTCSLVSIVTTLIDINCINC